MIIVEGCDATGKTTLVSWLAENLIAPKFKDSYHRNGANFYVETSLSRAAWSISDRFHLGEYVYPVVKQDGREPLKLWEQQMVERILQSKPSVLILCETDVETIQNNFRVRGEDFIDEGQVPKVLSLFNERFDQSMLPKIKFDYQRTSVKELVHFIHNVYAKYSYMSNVMKLTRSIGDPMSPDVMLVGEGFNQNKYNEHMRAFSHYSSSSTFLHETLGLNQGVRYYITNADKGSGSVSQNVDLMVDEIYAVMPRKIIALGDAAAEVVSRTSMPFKKAMHPSYVRRFKPISMMEYANELM